MTAVDADPVATVAVRSQHTGREVRLRVTYDGGWSRRSSSSATAPGSCWSATRAACCRRAKKCRQLPGAWWCDAGRLVGELILWRGLALAVNPEQRLVATLIDATVAHRAGLLPRSAWAPHALLCLPSSSTPAS